MHILHFWKFCQVVFQMFVPLGISISLNSHLSFFFLIFAFSLLLERLSIFTHVFGYIYFSQGLPIYIFSFFQLSCFFLLSTYEYYFFWTNELITQLQFYRLMANISSHSLTPNTRIILKQIPSIILFHLLIFLWVNIKDQSFKNIHIIVTSKEKIILLYYQINTVHISY